MQENKFSKLTNSGTSQEGRIFPALNFDYVKIDERKLEDLLVFTGGFSKLINFYNHHNKPEGDWSEFLTDESVLLATIIDSNPSGIESDFKRNLHKAILFKRAGKKVHYLKNCIRITYEVALKFQVWLTRLKAIEVFTGEEIAIKTEISSAITSKLGSSLKDLVKVHNKLNSSSNDQEKLVLNFSRFDNSWGLSEVMEEQTIEEITEQNTLNDLLHSIERIFQSFYETLLYLKIKSPDYFSKSLYKDTHYPETALLLSFLKLFKHAQNNLNLLTKKHLDFYYQDVLKQKYSDFVKDQVYLKFKVYNSIPLARVKKGARFIGGESGDGSEIIYTADYDLLINHARIEKLRTIHIPRRKLNVKGTEKILFRNILSADLPVSLLTRVPDENTPRKTFAAFGEDQQWKGAHEKTMQHAMVGFAIASPVLFLKEGHREIGMTMRFSSESFHSFLEKIADFAFTDKCPEEEVFIKCFLDAFLIEITSPQGWYPVKKYVVSRNIEERSLSVSFDLDNHEPSLSRYSQSVHGGNFTSKSPVIRFHLNNQSYIYPYSFLKDLILEDVKITVHVSGMKDLVLFNNMGQLNPDNPFYPFGSMPNKGSYLLIGNKEAFNKSLDSLKVNIEWFDLPSNNSGFFGHYQDYKANIDNSSFEAKISILENGRWMPSAKEQQTVKLFRSEGMPDKEDSLIPNSALDEISQLHSIATDKLKQLPDYSGILENLFTYTNTSQRGFLKLELSNPEEAFGHTIYPAVLSEKTIKNVKSGLLKFGEKKMEKMPNPPYTPQIKSISLDYSSSSTITLKDRAARLVNSELQGQVYHLHPFGEQLSYPDRSVQETFLLPDYTFEGSLMIGISDLNPPQTVSILFELFDEYSVSSEEDPPVIEWSYLANNRWHLIKPSKILKDGTNGFIRTGIIEIDLPYEINRNNTILDPSLFWIRATALKNVDVASNIVSVYTQVLTATLSEVNENNAKHLKNGLPAFSLTRSVENIEGVEEIIQPLKSFNGRPKEDEQSFYTRIAERLRHKNRAIMPWDYERLILEKFPSIYKVACLPNMTSQNLDAPGSVLLVICPRTPDDIEVNEPMASSELLFEIKHYISSLISPFVKLEVRNPGYERIKIICSVKFRNGYNYGYFLQQLNEELKKYLSQSDDKGNSGMHLGGKVNVSDILSFMRTLPYVDFITRFSMVQAARDFHGNWMLVDTAREGEAKSFLQATKPWSVLVPSIEHQITILNERQEERSLQAGIDYLELGEDFIIDE